MSRLAIPNREEDEIVAVQLLSEDEILTINRVMIGSTVSNVKVEWQSKPAEVVEALTAFEDQIMPVYERYTVDMLEHVRNYYPLSQHDQDALVLIEKERYKLVGDMSREHRRLSDKSRQIVVDAHVEGIAHQFRLSSRELGSLLSRIGAGGQSTEQLRSFCLPEYVDKYRGRFFSSAIYRARVILGDEVQALNEAIKDFNQEKKRLTNPRKEEVRRLIMAHQKGLALD